MRMMIILHVNAGRLGGAGEAERFLAAPIAGRLPRMKACDSSSEWVFIAGAWLKQREVHLPEYLSDDQIIEIPCVHCHTTSPKTIAWVRANDRYNCAGCNAPIVVERDALLAGVGLNAD